LWFDPCGLLDAGVQLPNLLVFEISGMGFWVALREWVGEKPPQEHAMGIKSIA
jgi:hypothetical protein